MSTTAFADCDTLPLLAIVEAAQASRLAGSPFGGLLPGEKVADLFCGAGGWGEGAREHGIRVDFAVNHSPVAIAAHRANNPRCVHHQGDAWKAKPRSVIGEGTQLGLLLASAACTSHSRAKGSAPISPRVHMLGWCIARWMREAQPRVVLIENVPEWKDWGPLVDKVGADGEPVRDGQGRIVKTQCPRRKGSHFRRWWRQCERLGYVLEMRVLDAKDYGSASTRKRLFVVARRDGAPICWPEVTHGKREAVDQDGVDQRGGGRGHGRGGRRRGGSADGGGVEPYRTAAECIDWSDLGRSIFDRDKPLADKTLERIAAGIGRYVINDPAPFVLRVTQTGGAGVGGSIRPVGEPMPTQTTRQDFAVVSPVMVRDGFAERPGQHPRSGRADEPLNTVCAGRTTAAVAAPVLRQLFAPLEAMLATPEAQENVRAALGAPVITPCGGPKRGPARPDAPYGTVLTREDRGIATPLLAYFRQHTNATRPDEPVRTMTADGTHAALVAPLLVGAGGSGYAAKPTRADRALNTVKCDDRRGLVAAFLMQYYGNATLQKPDGPLHTVVTKDRHALVVVHIGGEPFVIVDILFRMLKPGELAKAMGFRDSYRWPKTNRDTVKLIGNAVSPPMAAALVGAVLPGGVGGRKKGRAVA